MQARSCERNERTNVYLLTNYNKNIDKSKGQFDIQLHRQDNRRSSKNLFYNIEKTRINQKRCDCDIMTCSRATSHIKKDIDVIQCDRIQSLWKESKHRRLGSETILIEKEIKYEDPFDNEESDENEECPYIGITF